MLQSTQLIQELRQGSIEASSRDGYLNKVVQFLYFLSKYNPDFEEIVEEDGPAEAYQCPLTPEFKAFLDNLPADQTDAQAKKRIKAHITERPTGIPHYSSRAVASK